MSNMSKFCAFFDNAIIADGHMVDYLRSLLDSAQAVWAE